MKKFIVFTLLFFAVPVAIKAMEAEEPEEKERTQKTPKFPRIFEKFEQLPIELKWAVADKWVPEQFTNEEQFISFLENILNFSRTSTGNYALVSDPGFLSHIEKKIRYAIKADQGLDALYKTLKKYVLEKIKRKPRNSLNFALFKMLNGILVDIYAFKEAIKTDDLVIIQALSFKNLNPNYNNLLINAVSQNNIPLVTALSDWRYIDQGDELGRTALIYAIMENSFQMVKLLVKSGADVNKRSIFGETPLFFAINQFLNKESDLTTVEYLLAQGADPKISYEEDTEELLEALKNHDTETIQRLQDNASTTTPTG